MEESTVRMLTICMVQSPSQELTGPQLLTKFPATCPYPEPGNFSIFLQGLPSKLIPLGLPTKILYTRLPFVPHAQPVSFFLI